MQKRKPSRKLLKKLPLNRLPPNRPLLNRLPLNRLPLNRLLLNRLLLNRPAEYRYHCLLDAKRRSISLYSELPKSIPFQNHPQRINRRKRKIPRL